MRTIGKAKVSSQLPILRLIATEWNLKLNTPDGLRTAVRIANNSINKN